MFDEVISRIKSVPNFLSHPSCILLVVHTFTLLDYTLWLRNILYRVVQKTDTQIYCWDNFGNWAPILTILSLLQAEIYGA